MSDILAKEKNRTPPSHHPSPEEAAAGKSQREIARETGISHTHVATILDPEKKLPPERPEPPEEAAPPSNVLAALEGVLRVVGFE